MLNLFTSVLGDTFTAGTYLLLLGTAFLAGLITAFAASFKNEASKSFLAALILLPPVVTTVIMMVNGNVGTGIAVAGAFSLVRFRSAQGKARDIVSIFIVMTAGLACAAGYAGAAILFTLIVSAVMMLLQILPASQDRMMELSVTVPENLHFAEEFEDVFAKYTKSHRMVSSRTSNMGSLFKLNYRIEIKEPALMQEFMDELRIRNGNLEVRISECGEKGDEL